MLTMTDNCNSEEEEADAANQQQPSENDATTTSNDDIWIGLDFGTSNCACAVWDSAGGRAKLIRLGNLSKKQDNGKPGRIMPSTVLFFHQKNSSVGQAALEALQESFSRVEDSSYDVSSAIVSSVKRVLGLTKDQLQGIGRAFLESLPFEMDSSKDDNKMSIKLVPLQQQSGKPTSSSPVLIDPVEIAAIMLRAIRLQSQNYLDTIGKKKHLDVPGNSGSISNVVVGVPAHWSQTQRATLVEACRMAGFSGTIRTLVESTAASMAYGLNISSKPKAILVFDMGGGTTDVTIVCKKLEEDDDEVLQVALTEGDAHLGGNDMDELLLKVVLNKLHIPLKDLTLQQRQALLLQCRQGKEQLCSDGGTTSNDATTTISFSFNEKSHNVDVSMKEFNNAIQPLINRARTLVMDRAVARFQELHPTLFIDEVVLVGGATRVPLVRTMLQHEFPKVELCCSLNAETAVAQGLAIYAAACSKKVPQHELRSALMLDVLPHTIGVLSNHKFVPILQRDTTLPARGYATFLLAESHQPGVTVDAVEQVEEDQYEPLGQFTFLLRKLSEKKVGRARSVDIGMTLETSGKLIVSIFDENDPEHLEKKRRYQIGKQNQIKGERANLGYDMTTDRRKLEDNLLEEERMTLEQVMLMVGCVILFILYIAVKVTFSGPPEESARIL